MRPKKETLEKLTDFQIRGLAGLLGFSGALKGFVKSELPDVFLAALDKFCEGEMPEYVWRIGKVRTEKDSLASMKQRVAAAARELEAESTKKSTRKGTQGGASQDSPNPKESPSFSLKNPRRSLRLAGKSAEMELDDSDSDHDDDADIDDQRRMEDQQKKKSSLGQDTTDCFQSLSQDLQSVHTVLAQLHKLTSGPRRSKDLALIGMQDEIKNSMMMIQRLRTGLEVGRVSSTVKELKKAKVAEKKQDKKPMSYAEAARQGVARQAPHAPRAAAAWSSTRTFFLRPEDDANRTKEIPAWVFGAKLRQLFGESPEGTDPPLLRLHRTARGEWQMLVAAWVRDKIVAANQSRVDLAEHGWWIFERREVFSGPSAVISRVPLELSDQEIKRGLIDGSRSLLDPQYLQLLDAVRVQRLKRREVSATDPKTSTWVPGKSVRLIFPAEELRQKFLSSGGIYLYWQYVPIREYVPPTYYCSICKKRGGHSTHFHRGPANSGR